MFLFAAAELPDLVASLRRISPEEVLLPVLVQLVVIILAARIFAILFRRIGQPGVVGEIAAGIALGPSLLGYFFPDFAQAIFHPGLGTTIDPALADATLHWIFSALSHVGLILLLFLVGLEFDFSHLKDSSRSALAISLAGVGLPFLLGLAVSLVLLPGLEVHPKSGQPVSPWAFALFLGTAMSITAIPVLGRIMMELNITRTRLGAITISAAAVDDAIGWMLLATVAAIARHGAELGSTLLMLLETLAFAAAMIFLVKPLIVRWARRAALRGQGALSITDMTVLLVLVFAAAIVTNHIGIFAIFGAFLLGAILSGEDDFRRAVNSRLRDFVTAFFLPIFFTFTGLQTDVGTLRSPYLWALCGLVLLTATVGKLGGCALAAYVMGIPRRESLCIGTMMNARGLMELVVINVGYELRVIPPSIYCMLVIMALVTTVMTTPTLLRLMRGTELEPYIRESEFLGSQAHLRSAQAADRPAG